MKPFLLPCLALLAFTPLAQAAKPADDGVFHDPFADEGTATGKSSAPVSDPLEGMNRFFFKFNDKVYSWVLKPVAKGYSYVAPRPVRECVDRFFTNVKYPIRGVNNLLEGRFSGAGIETARFLINSTVGIGGLFDPANHYWDIKPCPANFDQTLAVYHVPAGCYLHLPILGPSSPRGVVGTTGDMFLNPAFYLGDDWWWVGVAITATDKINFTSLHYPEYDSLKAGTLDPYVAMRSAYLDNRRATLEKPEEKK